VGVEWLRERWVLLTIVAVVVMVLISPLFGIACERVGYSEPLENVGEEFGAEEIPIYENPPMPDYDVPALGNPALGGIISGIVGSLVVLLLAVGIGTLLKKP